MFTYERASLLAQLLEAIVLYEAVKNRRKETPDDEDIIRRHGKLRNEVRHRCTLLLSDEFQTQA